MQIIIQKFLYLFVYIIIFSIIYIPNVQAANSWGGYHWARTVNPSSLKIGDNLSLNWKPFLKTTAFDWSSSSMLDLSIVAGGTTSRRCRATAGRIEVCNYRYGKNGWLGLAQIWVSGTHITQGVTKVNDTYFNTAQYNTLPWRNLVMCQEVGHILGLDHQDEIFDNSNLGTCMDYTDDPSGIIKNQANNEHPNAHDFEELEIIYAHLDSLTTINSAQSRLPVNVPKLDKRINDIFETKGEWGREIRKNKRIAEYERDFGNNQKLRTFVILVEE